MLSIIRQEIRPTLALAGPVVAAQLAQMSMSFIDTVMVGRLGPLDLAASALGASVFYPAAFVFLGVLSAIGPLVSQAYGASDRRDAGVSLRQGIWLAGLLAVPSVLLLRNSGPFLDLVGVEPEVAKLTIEYMDALSWGLPGLYFFFALRTFMESVSRPRVAMVLTLGGVALNVTANYVLMYGKLGFPPLGLRGCGIATSLVHWAMLMGLFLFMRRQADLREFELFSRWRRPDLSRFREMIRIGWPIGVSQGLEGGIFSATAFLIGLLGVEVLAAHQIALRCAALTFMVPLGVSMAASVRVGQAVGRGRLDLAAAAGYCGVFLGACFMSIAALAFLIAPRAIVSLFLDVGAEENLSVVDIAVQLLAAAALFQVFDGIQVAAIGALRGLKDTRAPMAIALVSYWGVGLGSGWLLAFDAGWGAIGLWFGLASGLFVAAVLLLTRFHRLVRHFRA